MISAAKPASEPRRFRAGSAAPRTPGAAGIARPRIGQGPSGASGRLAAGSRGVADACSAARSIGPCRLASGRARRGHAAVGPDGIAIHPGGLVDRSLADRSHCGQPQAAARFSAADARLRRPADIAGGGLCLSVRVAALCFRIPDHLPVDRSADHERVNRPARQPAGGKFRRRYRRHDAGAVVVFDLGYAA